MKAPSPPCEVSERVSLHLGVDRPRYYCQFCPCVRLHCRNEIVLKFKCHLTNSLRDINHLLFRTQLCNQIIANRETPRACQCFHTYCLHIWLILKLLQCNVQHLDDIISRNFFACNCSPGQGSNSKKAK